MRDAGTAVSSRKRRPPICAAPRIPPTVLRIPPAINGPRAARSLQEDQQAPARNSESKDSCQAIEHTPEKAHAPAPLARENPPEHAQPPSLPALPHKHPAVNTQNMPRDIRR